MIPELVVEGDQALTEIISRAVSTTNIHADNAVQEVLERVFESISEKRGIQIKYPSQAEVLQGISELGIRELHMHQAVNSKMLSFLFESLMSKAILAMGRFIEDYINRVDEVLVNEPNMQTVVGSLRALFDLMEQMERMRNKYALGDPDRILSPNANTQIDRDRIDKLRREINDISD